MCWLFFSPHHFVISILLLLGEIVVNEVNFVRKCISAENSQEDLWGKLICTNFKVSFIPQDDSSKQVFLQGEIRNMKLSQFLLPPIFPYATHLARKSKKIFFLPWLSLTLWIKGVQTQSSGVAFTRKIIYLGVNFACPIGLKKMAQLWPLRTGFERSSCRTALKKLWFQDGYETVLFLACTTEVHAVPSPAGRAWRPSYLSGTGGNRYL